MDTISLSLPFPPSVNHAYANGGNGRGRYKTDAYKAWEKMAALSVKDSHRIGLSGPYTLYIGYRAPDRRIRDLGNYEKCVSDFLVAQGVIKDDNLSQRIVLEWDSTIESGCVVIVRPYGGVKQ